MCGKALRAFQSHLSDNGDNLQPDAKKFFVLVLYGWVFHQWWSLDVLALEGVE